jgi:lipopolysaccharide/colanic/teichoic acid biosynthesis glycosyltransferase
LRRLDVRPGLIGLWQVQVHQDASHADRDSLDVTYAKNWSIWLDIKAILRTIAVILMRTGK